MLAPQPAPVAPAAHSAADPRRPVRVDFGWYGDADIRAATRYLARRSDVVPDRIGLVGMSMGGEEAIGASGSTAVRAVVAEGAAARTAGDEAWLSDEYGARGWLQEQFERGRTS